MNLFHIQANVSILKWILDMLFGQSVIVPRLLSRFAFAIKIGRNFLGRFRFLIFIEFDLPIPILPDFIFSNQFIFNNTNIYFLYFISKTPYPFSPK